MTTKGNQDIATGFAVTAGDGEQEVKVPEDIMKPKYMNDSQHHQRAISGGEETPPPDTTTQGIAAGDAVGNARLPYEAAAANIVQSPNPEVRIPEGIMKPVLKGREDELPLATASAPIVYANTSNAVASGHALDGAGELKTNDADKVKVPEAVMKPRMSAVEAVPLIAVANVSRNVAGGEPLDAMGFKVDEPETKIPEGVMKPRIAGANPQHGLSSNSGDSASIPEQSVEIAAGTQLIDANGNLSAEGQAKIPDGIMKPAI